MQEAFIKLIQLFKNCWYAQLLGALGFCFLGWITIDAIRNTSDPAAWVQAIGSLLALFVAVGISLLEAGEKQKIRRRKDRGLAVRFLTALQLFEAMAEANINACAEAEEEGLEMILVEYCLCDEMTVVREMLAREIDDLLLPMQNLYQKIVDFEWFMKLETKSPDGLSFVLPMTYGDYLDHLEEILSFTTESIAELNSLIGRKI